MTIIEASADANAYAETSAVTIASTSAWHCYPPRRMVVATDLSPASRTSFGCAGALAGSFNASLTLFHVSRPRARETARRAQHELLARERSTLQACGISAESAFWAGRTPWRAIVAYGNQVEADCIVVARRGLAEAQHTRLGRTTSRLLRYAQAAVLVAGPTIAGGRQGWRADRVVVPFDFSSHSVMTLAAAVEWCAQIEAPLHVVHVVRQPPMPSSSSIAFREWLREITDMAAQRLRDVVAMHPTAPITTRVMLGRSVALTLVDALLTPQDLVLMASQGMGRARSASTPSTKVGSTAERVLALAPCSVVTFNPATLARLSARGAQK